MALSLRHHLRAWAAWASGADTLAIESADDADIADDATELAALQGYVLTSVERHKGVTVAHYACCGSALAIDPPRAPLAIRDIDQLGAVSVYTYPEGPVLTVIDAYGRERMRVTGDDITRVLGELDQLVSESECDRCASYFGAQLDRARATLETAAELKRVDDANDANR